MEQGRKGLMSLGRVPPLFLAGEKARDWAKMQGLAVYEDPEQGSLITQAAMDRWRNYTDRLTKYCALPI